jgi:hypothetical protein
MRCAWATLAFVMLCSPAREAAADCGDDASVAVGLTTGAAVLSGAAASLIASGILVAADDTRDFAFGTGAGVGIGVTAGLALVYALVDGSSGCTMVDERSAIVWSVPITTTILGALLPIAMWGAADSVEAEPTATPDMTMQSVTISVHF